MLNARDLPNDVESLKRLVLEHRAEIEHLRNQLARLRRMQYGRSSEKLNAAIAQLELTLEALESQPPAQRTERPRVRPSRVDSPQYMHPIRQALPEHLPRQDTLHTVSCDNCPSCGGELRHLDDDTSEVLEWVRSSLKVLRHVRPKMSCRKCATIVQAPAPSRPIPRSFAGASLLAHVLTAKFCDHVPLYRQSQIFAREGVDLARSTLADWVGESAKLLTPLVEAVRAHVFGAQKVHADDTPIPVLAPGNGKTKQGRLWVYVSDDRGSGNTRPPAVWFAYSPDRRAEHPRRHLQGFHGILQSDGYDGFENLCDRRDVPEHERVTGAGCWSHARRKFFDFYVANRSPIAKEAIDRIDALFVIEAQIRGRPPDKRAAIRRARAGPLLDEFRPWLLAQLAKLPKKSQLAIAIRYALNRWRALTRYVHDGRIEMHNNAAERALRGVALGRKNFMFAGSDLGGDRAAAIYALVETAKLYGLDPQHYLHYVLERIAEHPIHRIEELLPWHLADAATAPQAQAA